MKYEISYSFIKGNCNDILENSSNYPNHPSEAAWQKFRQYWKDLTRAYKADVYTLTTEWSTDGSGNEDNLEIATINDDKLLNSIYQLKYQMCMEYIHVHAWRESEGKIRLLTFRILE